MATEERALERAHELNLNAEEARRQAREGSETGNGCFNIDQCLYLKTMR